MNIPAHELRRKLQNLFDAEQTATKSIGPNKESHDYVRAFAYLSENIRIIRDGLKREEERLLEKAREK